MPSVLFSRIVSFRNHQDMSAETLLCFEKSFKDCECSRPPLYAWTIYALEHFLSWIMSVSHHHGCARNLLCLIIIIIGN